MSIESSATRGTSRAGGHTGGFIAAMQPISEVWRKYVKYPQLRTAPCLSLQPRTTSGRPSNGLYFVNHRSGVRIPEAAFLIAGLDGARYGPPDRILDWTMPVSPLDQGLDLPSCNPIPSDPNPRPRAQRSGGNRIVDAENSAVIRLAIDDHLDATWRQTFLRRPHGDQSRQAAGLGGPKQPTWGGRPLRAAD